MLNFKSKIEESLITESKVDKNLHLEHLEDQVLNNGISGTRESILFLRSLRDMLSGHSKSSVDITVKWDGAPAIFAGINPENGKFFVGTKGVFAKTAKLNYTDEDIDNNHPASGLNKKLKYALAYLPELNIKGVLQGDMLFTKGDIKKETISNEDYIIFQPNTIVYAIPVKSKLAQMMMAAKLGVVFHTEYHGKTMESMKATFGANVSKLSHSKNVWFRDASFTDASGSATFTEDETKKINEILTNAGNLFRDLSPKVLNKIAANEELKLLVKTYNNMKVRAGEPIKNTVAHANGLIQYINEKSNKEIIAAKKAETKRKREMEKNELISFFQPNLHQFKLIFDMQNIIVAAKNMIIRKLERVRDVGTFLRTSDGYKITAPEGFVAIDKLSGNAVKLVDRLTFSHANFTATKSWDK